MPLEHEGGSGSLGRVPRARPDAPKTGFVFQGHALRDEIECAPGRSRSGSAAPYRRERPGAARERDWSDRERTRERSLAEKVKWRARPRLTRRSAACATPVTPGSRRACVLTRSRRSSSECSCRWRLDRTLSEILCSTSRRTPAVRRTPRTRVPATAPLSRAHPPSTRAALAAWVQASCYIRALTFQERHVYHEGKYADARNALYERGWLFELQPAWNVTVTPSQSIGGALGGGARGASWDARLLAHVRYSQARRCEGHVGEDLARTVAQCTDGEHAGWISPVLEINGSVPCFAHSTNRTFTYLSVSEPFGFYLDGIAAAFCLVLGITVAYELIRGRPW